MPACLPLHWRSGQHRSPRCSRIVLCGQAKLYSSTVACVPCGSSWRTEGERSPQWPIRSVLMRLLRLHGLKPNCRDQYVGVVQTFSGDIAIMGGI